MNVATSSQNIKPTTLVTPDQSQMQGARVADGDGKSALKKALEEARLHRKDEEQSLESQQKRQTAALRTVRGNQQVSRSSKEAKAALDIAKALGLNTSACKALLQKDAPADLAHKLSTMLKKQSIASIESSINDPEMQPILGKAINALNSSDPFGALGVSPEAVCSLVPSAVANSSQNTAADFAKAIGEAMGMIQKLMGKSAETAALLAKFESAFETLKAAEASNTIKYMQAQQAHYDHEKHKMDTLGILKKIFGAIIAAILAAIAAITVNPGLAAVAIVIGVTTFVPKAMDTICEGFARDVLQLKGKAAEAVALYMRTMIALLLTVASGGAGSASAIGNALSAVGTFAGSLMLTGGAENIANLKVDCEHNCDVYSGDVTDAEQAEADKDAQIAGYVLLAIAAVGMIGNFGISLASRGEGAAPTVEQSDADAPAVEDGPTIQGAGEAQDAAEEVEEMVEDAESAADSKDAEAKKNADAKDLRKRNLLRAANYGLAGANAGNGGIDISIGVLMLSMANTIEDLIKTQGALSMSQASIKIDNQEMKRDQASDQAITSQGIDSMKNITIDESIAYQHQIVGATAV